MWTAPRVSEVDPGAFKTEFGKVRWNDKEKASRFYQDFKLHVNVFEIVVYPQAQASLTDIYRIGDPIKSLFNIKSR